MKRKSKQWFESYPETRCNTQQCKGKSLQKKLFYMKSSKVEYLGLIFSSYLSMTYIQLPANIRLDEDVLYMWESFFHKLAGWHLATSLQINFSTDNFQEFKVNERLQMATSSCCTKCLKITSEVAFLLYLLVEIFELVHEVSV